MTAKYFAILTNQGAARLANAAALGTKLNLTQMAVGDANGTLPTPDPAQTKLINQKRIAPLNLLNVDPANTSQIIAEQIIPENEGGFWIREIGLYDDAGVLIAVANCPETYKPQLQEGSGRTQTIRMILVVSSTSAITLKIDPSVVLATRQHVDEKIIEVKAYAVDQMEKHVAAANPHKQYPLIANALKEIADAGLITEALKNLGLESTVKQAAEAVLSDDASYAGFELGRITSPYLRQKSSNTVVRLATKDYADFTAETIRENIVDSAPSNMDTLKKISLALGDDAGFALTMRSALNIKQPLDDTLTNLSGKNTAEIRAFLGLKSAALRDIGSGANQIPDMNGFTSSLTSPGWQKLPSGLIIQWGTANPSETGETTIMFPIAFSAYPLYMGFGPQQVSLPNTVQSPVISAPTLNNRGCGMRNLMIGTNGGVPVASQSSFFWIAVGL